MKCLNNLVILALSVTSVHAVFGQASVTQQHFAKETAVYTAKSGFEPGPVTFTVTEIPAINCIPEDTRRDVLRRIEANKARLGSDYEPVLNSPRSVHPQFIWPTQAKEGFDDYGYYTVNFLVDHNPAYNSFTDYNCGDRSYDWVGGNHEGTDIIYWPYGWGRMQEEIMEIVAAAPGVIIDKRDGNYDLNCSNNGNSNWNGIVVEHTDGSQAWYWHFKNGAITEKEIGESVAAGEYLGAAGSSGSSNWPHLHFEIYDADGNLTDPWAGACNDFNDDSWWENQQPYHVSRINHISTHDTQVLITDCPNAEVTHEETDFAAGDSLFLRIFYRDIQQLQLTSMSLVAPDGSDYATWEFINTWGDDYATADAFWFFEITDSWPLGTYLFRAVFAGETYETEFNVGSVGIAGRTENTLRLYPNPAKGQVEIHLPSFPAVATLYDITGRKIHTRRLASETSQIDVSHFPEGMYLLHFLLPGGAEESVRLVVARE